jgi:histone H3/H4
MAKLAKSKVKKLTLEKSGMKRISGKALPMAERIAVAVMNQIGEKAGSIARAFGRKTIMPEDLEQACKMLWGGDACQIRSGERGGATTKLAGEDEEDETDV